MTSLIRDEDKRSVLCQQSTTRDFWRASAVACARRSAAGPEAGGGSAHSAANSENSPGAHGFPPQYRPVTGKVSQIQLVTCPRAPNHQAQGRSPEPPLGERAGAAAGNGLASEPCQSNPHQKHWRACGVRTTRPQVGQRLTKTSAPCSASRRRQTRRRNASTPSASAASASGSLTMPRRRRMNSAIAEYPAAALASANAPSRPAARTQSSAGRSSSRRTWSTRPRRCTPRALQWPNNSRGGWGSMCATTLGAHYITSRHVTRAAVECLEVGLGALGAPHGRVVPIVVNDYRQACRASTMS